MLDTAKFAFAVGANRCDRRAKSPLCVPASGPLPTVSVRIQFVVIPNVYIKLAVFISNSLLFLILCICLQGSNFVQIENFRDI